MRAGLFARMASRAAVAAALVAGVVAAGSCVSERSTGTTSTDDCITPPSAAGLPIVFVKQFAYIPAQIHVHAGQSVAWVNCESDGTPHTATADDASFDSKLLNPNDAYVRAFPVAGTTPYHCDLHPFMKAAVIVD
jgi:plastocyanin